MITRPAILNAIRAHGRAAYPEEGCGFLLGHAGPEGNTILTIRPVENRHAEMLDYLRRLATTGFAYTGASVVSKLFAVALLPVYTALIPTVAGLVVAIASALATTPRTGSRPTDLRSPARMMLRPAPRLGFRKTLNMSSSKSVRLLCSLLLH